jgi:hypothetical protein
MNEDRLEERLRELGSDLDVPEAETLAEDVGTRLREARRRRPMFSAGLAAALAVVVIGGGALAYFLIPGVEIRRVPTPPTASAPGEPELLDLGRQVSLAEAREAVDINVLVPQRLGRPDAVFVGRQPPGGRVTMVYEPTADLPEDENTGVGMLVTLFRGSTDTGFVQKEAGPETSVRPITVEGAPGMWIEGAPHTVVYVDTSGRMFPDTLRLAGNVLIWQLGDITLRLESRLPLDPSLEVAGSMA